MGGSVDDAAGSEDARVAWVLGIWRQRERRNERAVIRCIID
jgi:hypothetical protein